MVTAYKQKKPNPQPTRLELMCALADIFTRLRAIVDDMNGIYSRQQVSRYRAQAEYKQELRRRTKEMRNNN